jgi:hypothetical protein
MRTQLARIPLTRTWQATRIEATIGAGLPDVELCDDEGLYHKVELKSQTGSAVALRPSQVAYMARHTHASVWVLIRKAGRGSDCTVFLYHARQAVDLKTNGLATPPVLKLDSPKTWAAIFERIKKGVDG